MRYLLDTHTLLWYVDGNPQLPDNVGSIVTDTKNLCFFSVASIWEMSIKISLQKLQLKFSLEELLAYLSKNSISILEINPTHTITLLNMPFIHRDPFDRMLIAQAKTENLALITKDNHIKQYPDIKTLW